MISMTRLGRWIVICFCLMICCSCSFAENVISLSGPGYDALRYACTLPDGRMIFSGYRGEIGNYQETKARLLCLNPDKTVSWEYWDPADGQAAFNAVILQKDGTLGVFYANSPYQTLTDRKLRFFTTEGEPLEKTVNLYRADSLLTPVGLSCLEMTVIPGDATEYYHHFLDWDGKELFKISSEEKIAAFHPFEAENGLVLAGHEPTWPANAKIMKLNLKGDIIWETVLPTHLEVSPDASLEWSIQTSDGGYLALYHETSWLSDDIAPQRYKALVKFDQNGRLLWMNHESFPAENNPICHGLSEYKGKYVMELSTCADYFDVRNPRIFCWFDENGHELGRTELQIRREDLDVPEDTERIENVGGMFVMMQDGLWSLRDIWTADDDHMAKMDSRDEILFKVPEL